MCLDERINHVRYALDRRETLLKSKIDRRFPVSVFAVYRRVSKVEKLRDELSEIMQCSLDDYSDALKRLENIEEALYGVL
ncbi:hypothetical protein SAMN04488100_10911 [Alkalibacterium putridalgicola]|uniref:Uncharacterized protein n=1 Tax=Alkalibacterium putridalgicola TaxID=426703 RepID=A0A1H7SNY0_9LACT|nr:hypothetical protein [Alkalibacterium putridalgicola]GEK89199.1 hypothetical protein APU01nite_12380 [Alkalibacterium putridalgicola]SEL74178.1 hypothetical protein SAMN04488100_10911 [Alkalibacterium putridalgicola]